MYPDSEDTSFTDQVKDEIAYKVKNEVYGMWKSMKFKEEANHV